MPKDDLDLALKFWRARGKLGFERVQGDPEVVKISVVGVGMRSYAGVGDANVPSISWKRD